MGEALAQLRPRHLALAVGGLGAPLRTVHRVCHPPVEARQRRPAQQDALTIVGEPQIDYGRCDPQRGLDHLGHRPVAGRLVLVQRQATLRQCLLQKTLDAETRLRAAGSAIRMSSE